MSEDFGELTNENKGYNIRVKGNNKWSPTGYSVEIINVLDL